MDGKSNVSVDIPRKGLKESEKTKTTRSTGFRHFTLQIVIQNTNSVCFGAFSRNLVVLNMQTSPFEPRMKGDVASCYSGQGTKVPSSSKWLFLFSPGGQYHNLNGDVPNIPVITLAGITSLTDRKLVLIVTPGRSLSLHWPVFWVFVSSAARASRAGARAVGIANAGEQSALSCQHRTGTYFYIDNHNSLSLWLHSLQWCRKWFRRPTSISQCQMKTSRRGSGRLSPTHRLRTTKFTLWVRQTR